MELTKLTRALLAQGYTKENPPDEYREWEDYSGGWTYGAAQIGRLWVETPCGLRGHAHTIGGMMSYMGIDWCLENDNYVICCPHRKRGCELNDPLLKDLKYTQCATRLVDMPPEGSKDTLQAAYDAYNKRCNEMLQAWVDKRGGRYCPYMTRMDYETGKVYTWYDPRECAKDGCKTCQLTGEEMDPKRGNVYYDLCTETREGNDDLIGYRMQVHKRKGEKLFAKTASMTICKRAEKMPDYIAERVAHDRDISRQMFFAKYHGVPFRYWVENIRAERRETRDMLQDLKDIADGITVVHASDEEKETKEKKRERRQEAKYKGLIRREKLCRTGDFTPELIAHYRRRLERDEDMKSRVLAALDEENMGKQKREKHEQLSLMI